MTGAPQQFRSRVCLPLIVFCDKGARPPPGATWLYRGSCCCGVVRRFFSFSACDFQTVDTPRWTNIVVVGLRHYSYREEEEGINEENNRKHDQIWTIAWVF